MYLHFFILEKGNTYYDKEEDNKQYSYFSPRFDIRRCIAGEKT